MQVLHHAYPFPPSTSHNPLLMLTFLRLPATFCAPPPSLSIPPRSRLTQIFAVSQSYLYHAYAWLKLFNFSRSFNKNLTSSDTQVRPSLDDVPLHCCACMNSPLGSIRKHQQVSPGPA